MTTTSARSKAFLALSLLVTVAVALPGQVAEGEVTQGCRVTSVGWSTHDNQRLDIGCSETPAGGGNAKVYVYKAWGPAATPPTGCNPVSVDTLKAWSSLAQSATLSGTKLYLVYAVCGAERGLSFVRLP